MKAKYELDDNHYDIIAKNKTNILELVKDVEHLQTKNDIQSLADSPYATIDEFFNNATPGEAVTYNDKIYLKGTGTQYSFTITPEELKQKIQYSDGTEPEANEIEGVTVKTLDGHTKVSKKLLTWILNNKSEIINLTNDVNQLAEEIQVIENTWKGNQSLTGGDPTALTFDLNTIQGNRGKFTFEANDKLILSLGLNGSIFGEEKVFRINTQTIFHIVGKTLDGGATTDVTFTAIIGANGILTIKNFQSTGSTNHNITDVRIKIVEQNPKAVAVIDAYTKAETDTKLADKADVTAVYTKAETDFALQTKAEKDLSNSTAIKYYQGTGEIFYETATVKPIIPAVFNNATLFEKHIFKEGYAIVGGTDGTEWIGEIGSHKHIDGLPVQATDMGQYGVSGSIPPSKNPKRFDGRENGGYGAYTSTVGGPANLAAGVKLLKVVYIAKKDISFNEMI